MKQDLKPSTVLLTALRARDSICLISSLWLSGQLLSFLPPTYLHRKGHIGFIWALQSNTPGLQVLIQVKVEGVDRVTSGIPIG